MTPSRPRMLQRRFADGHTFFLLWTLRPLLRGPPSFTCKDPEASTSNLVDPVLFCIRLLLSALLSPTNPEPHRADKPSTPQRFCAASQCSCSGSSMARCSLDARCSSGSCLICWRKVEGSKPTILKCSSKVKSLPRRRISPLTTCA